MNSTIDHLDRSTHLKIVAVAIIAAALVLAIGKTAQLDRHGGTSPAAQAQSTDLAG